MIQTYQALKDWFLMLKLPRPVMANEFAMTAWTRALEEQSLGRIYAFWCMAGMDLYIKDQICWSDIQSSLLEN